jgi:hypothetical protein
MTQGFIANRNLPLAARISLTKLNLGTSESENESKGKRKTKP